MRCRVGAWPALPAISRRNPCVPKLVSRAARAPAITLEPHYVLLYGRNADPQTTSYTTHAPLLRDSSWNKFADENFARPEGPSSCGKPLRYRYTFFPRVSSPLRCRSRRTPAQDTHRCPSHIENGRPRFGCHWQTSVLRDD